MILTAEWALQTAMTAAIAAGSGYVATRLTARAFDAGKKQAKDKAVTTCPLQGCLSCHMRNESIKTETLTRT